MNRGQPAHRVVPIGSKPKAALHPSILQVDHEPRGSEKTRSNEAGAIAASDEVIKLACLIVARDPEYNAQPLVGKQQQQQQKQQQQQQKKQQKQQQEQQQQQQRDTRQGESRAT